MSEHIKPIYHPHNTLLVSKAYRGDLSRQYETYENIQTAIDDANSDNQVIVLPGTYDTAEEGVNIYNAKVHFERGAIVTSTRSGADGAGGTIHDEGGTAYGTASVTGHGQFFNKAAGAQGANAVYFTKIRSFLFEADYLHSDKSQAFYYYPGSTQITTNLITPSIVRVKHYRGSANVLDADGEVGQLIFDGGYVDNNVGAVGPAVYFAQNSKGYFPSVEMRNMTFVSSGNSGGGTFIYEEIGDPGGGSLVVSGCRIVNLAEDLAAGVVQIDFNNNNRCVFQNCTIESRSATAKAFTEILSGGDVYCINTTANVTSNSTAYTKTIQANMVLTLTPRNACDWIINMQQDANASDTVKVDVLVDENMNAVPRVEIRYKNGTATGTNLQTSLQAHPLIAKWFSASTVTGSAVGNLITGVINAETHTNANLIVEKGLLHYSPNFVP